MADSSRFPRQCLPSDRGLLDGGARKQLVDALRVCAGIERVLVPPRDWAERSGFAVTAVALPDALTEPELSDGRTVVYLWHPNERERGIRVYCGLSRALLRLANIEHDSHDIWRLALELALPGEVHRAGLERLSRAQPHCPVDVIRDVLAGRW